MMWEIVVIGVLLIIVLYSRGLIDGNKFVKDNDALFNAGGRSAFPAEDTR